MSFESIHHPDFIDYKKPTLDSLEILFRIVSIRPPMSGKGWAYRGQSDIGWDIISSAGRTYKNPSITDLDIFSEWRKQAVAFHPKLPKEDLECLAFAQHHGLATRLVDWSFNPLVALFFAVNENEKFDGALFLHFSNDYALSSEPLKKITKIKRFRSRPLHPRILAQNSIFTVHPGPREKLKAEKLDSEADLIYRSESSLLRFRIPKERKSSLRLQLHEFGIDESRIYPGIEGLSRSLNHKYGEDSFFLKIEKDMAEMIQNHNSKSPE